MTTHFLGQRIRLPQPGKGIQSGAMSPEHPFGPPVGPEVYSTEARLLSRDPTDRIVVTLSGNSQPVRIQTDDPSRMFRQLSHELGLG